jgi:NAD-dependent dihydropyrimidine dehydrogenase PreA subunit
MAGRKLTVVISQAPGKNPVKRHLEEEIATRLMLSGVAEVSVVPHLYDLTADHTGMLWLKSLKGNLVVLGWLYPRAIRWVLDRNGVKGQEGESRLNVTESDEGDEIDEQEAIEEAEPQGIGAINVPNRLIFAIDLRNDPDPETYLSEIKRLADSLATPLVQLSGLFGAPMSSIAPTSNGSTNGNGSIHANGQRETSDSVASADVDHAPPTAPKVIGGENVRRRWYPVIDYSRCTNCMECLDFCLFGVYGVDLTDRILVEQEDNCKKGCPACSRVCPANAIVFPEHKTPAIAGAEGGTVEDFKIDLSKLFGAPSALEMAVLERDVELVADGREAVGAAVGIPKRQEGLATKPRDELDDLMDGLDALDL